jgi:hypothetical protein
MFQKLPRSCLLTAVILIAPAHMPSQDSENTRTLIINGQATQVSVIQVKGHSYVDLEALANAVNGSLSYSATAIALSMPIGSAYAASSAAAPVTPAQAPLQAVPSSLGFSREFLTAGIEQMSTLREWHTPLATAIQNGIPVSAALLAPYRSQAATNLRLAMVAATRPSDRSAYHLLNNEFQNMVKLSDKHIKLRDNLTYVAPDALESNDLNQRIIACGHSLGAMAASVQFVDDGSCH